ncbi:GntR family transcriptional regulator [Yoonia sediminilitoris]|uniref:GntR family transcriptional regulator n=1 Tax=Yoonia sediminilitoris TaxID=1286148 RepID=A0A2T6K4Q1_9RHOB|nr:GntR family transcriptional regulator [Yoonia sediminilitoris]PUB09632.1 GntR family transcriptional regulator [Yoonia sediminilitoris]RCW89539.1 GntR family transcriptional regulator [Yoonia sediminilitoris]
MDDTGSNEGSATHGAYLTLRDMILTGALPASQKLKIEQLRAILDTGASPVREALSLLTSDMLVERIDQRGFRAAPANKANFEEILALRCTLEDLALRQSIAGATPSWEEKLVVVHHRMKKASDKDLAVFEEAHKIFHMALLANSGSPMLERFCSQLYDLNIRYRYLAARSSAYQQRDVSAEHDEILDATIQGDADRASAALLQHYQLTGEYLARALDT